MPSSVAVPVTWPDGKVCGGIVALSVSTAATPTPTAPLTSAPGTHDRARSDSSVPQTSAAVSTCSGLPMKVHTPDANSPRRSVRCLSLQVSTDRSSAASQSALIPKASAARALNSPAASMTNDRRPRVNAAATLRRTAAATAAITFCSMVYCPVGIGSKCMMPLSASIDRCSFPSESR